MAAQSPVTTERSATAHPTARHHCKKLAEVIAKYLTDEELADFVQAQLRFAWAVTLKRYAPGLLDASYEAFATAQLRKGA